MTDPATIRAVCAKLDPANDGHWTSQGLPRMDVLAGMGLSVERRALNEALPGFNRAKAGEARAGATEDPSGAPAATPEEQGPPSFFLLAKERARRRAAALEHLAKGGFTLKDLEPVRSRLDQRIGQRNRAERRAAASH